MYQLRTFPTPIPLAQLLPRGSVDALLHLDVRNGEYFALSAIEKALMIKVYAEKNKNQATDFNLNKLLAQKYQLYTKDNTMLQLKLRGYVLIGADYMSPNSGADFMHNHNLDQYEQSEQEENAENKVNGAETMMETDNVPQLKGPSFILVQGNDVNKWFYATEEQTDAFITSGYWAQKHSRNLPCRSTKFVSGAFEYVVEYTVEGQNNEPYYRTLINKTTNTRRMMVQVNLPAHTGTPV
jgi:hypothetical protein